MIPELRTAVELVAKCSEDVQRIAAATLFAQATQYDVRCRIAARIGGRAPRKKKSVAPASMGRMASD